MKKSQTAPRSSKASRARGQNDLQIKVFWGDVLYDTVLCGPKESVTVGRLPHDTFIMDIESIKLVEVSENKNARIQFNDTLDGHVKVGSEFLSFRSAIAGKHVTRDEKGFFQAQLGATDRADFIIGHVSFFLDWIDHSERIPHAKLLSKSAFKYIALVGLLLLALFAVFTFVEPEPDKPPERLVTLMTPKRAAKAAAGEHQTADGGAQSGEAGKAQMKPVEKPSAAATLRSANLGSLVSGLTSLGASAPNVPTDSGATAQIAQTGTGGFTTQGLKSGAGGKTVGIGRTVGQGEGGFEGTGRLGLSGNSAVEGGTGEGDPGTTTGGGLDQDVIESIIRRRLDRIRLCYERQLNFNPKLSGKVAVHFVIGKTGAVVTARASEDTMNNSAVRECILTEVQSWTFPQPEGGTLVNVDYPFVFESSAKAQ